MNVTRESASSSTLVEPAVGSGLPAGVPACGAAAGGLVPEAPPPGSNTGGRLTDGEGVEVGRVKVDWLTIVFPSSRFSLVVDVISDVMGQGELTDVGLYRYASSWRWATGAILASSDEGVNADTCCLVLSGSVVDYFTPEKFLEFIQWCEAVGGRCSRLDVAFDDLSRQVLRMEDVHAAAESGNFAGFRSHRPVVEKMRRGTILGDCHYFGKRGKNGGGRMVRFYDKNLESGGQINAVRMEVEFSKKHAAAAFSLLAQSRDVDHLTSQVAGLLGGSIRFLDRSSGEVHLERCAELGWWSKVLEVLGTLRIRVRRAAPPLQRAMEYMRDAWSVNLAQTFEIAESQGRDGEEAVWRLMQVMVSAGKAKLDAGHRPGVKDLGLDFGRLLAP